MSKLEPRLRYLLEAGAPAPEHAAEFGVRTSAGGPPTIRVLLQVQGDAADLGAVGFQVQTRAGDVVGGELPLANLGQLEGVASVLRVESARILAAELDLSRVDVRADQVQAAATPYKGTGVIVAVVDSGIDYVHACFRKADGTSRILFLWDHSAAATATHPAPAGFPFGAEYTKAHLDAALANANPTSIVPHTDTDTDSGHGTHVAGIAAGNGLAAGGGVAANTIIGVAPEADIIVVAYNSNSNALGDSVRALQSFDYVFKKAAALRKPAVINFSQGDNLGPHDGTSLLERGIDNLLDGTPGRAIVKSAGNAGAGAVHASGTWAAAAVTNLTFQVPPGGANTIQELDLWYSGRDRIRFTLTNPAGNVSASIADTVGVTVVNVGGASVRFEVALDNPNNHDNRVHVIITPPIAGMSGGWTWAITPTTVLDGRFHCWIQRGGGAARFTTLTSNSHSLSVPGTSREVIAVANYVTRTGGTAAPVGQLQASSSRGPTRDGRIKPEIAAPGTLINSAASAQLFPPSATPYHQLSGTSMSTPHVTGTIALVFQKYPGLVASQVRRGLEVTGRTDATTGTVPNTDWGWGRLDTKAMVDRVYPQPIAEDWVRIQPRMGNWALAPTPPIFDIAAQENGEVVIELAWDPASLLTPSTAHTGADALRYYNTALDFQKTVTNADGSTRNVNVPASRPSLTGNRLSWVMPQALWEGYREEAAKSLRSPPTSTFSRNLYYRVRVTPTGAAEAIVWPADAAIQGNPNAPRLGLLRTADIPSPRTIPDPAAVAAMGGIPGHPETWGNLLSQLWTDLPETDADRQALARVFAHAAFQNELTVQQRGRLLTLWLFAGPTSRRRLPELLERRAWINQTDTVPIATVLDRTRARTLTENLLALTSLVPHRDISGVLTPEQLVDDVLTEVIDPNGRVNRGNSYTGTVTAVQAMLIAVNPSEYVRIVHGLLGQGGVVNLANGENVEVPAGVFQIARYGAAQADPLYVRTYAELAFQTALLAYGVGSTFPHADATAAPDSPTGVATVFRATLRTGLTLDQQRRVLAGVFNVPFTGVMETPSAGLRDRFVTAARDTRVPLLLILDWPDAATTPGLAGVLALRFDTGRLFFKNPQYPGSRPPTEARVGVTVNQPPRRYEDPPSTLESIGDADLAAVIRGYLLPNASLL
jgi:subtilisin family serine protease